MIHYLVFITQACAGQNSIKNNFCWLNTEFIECVKNKLPCECEEITLTYFSITLDTVPDSRFYGIALLKSQQLEPFVYPIRKLELNKYELLVAEDSNNSWARIEILNDTLFFFEDNTLSKFINLHGCSEFNALHYRKANVDLFNKALEDRGYPRIEAIVGHDNLGFYCNHWLGGLNLLSTQGKPFGWVINILNDTLTINEIINIERDPEDPILMKEIHCLRWN